MTAPRLLLSWLVLLVVGFTNGVVRQLGWTRVLPERIANQVAVATGIAALGVAVWLLTRVWPLASAAQAWRAGALWSALTFAFETGMGLAAGHPWSRIFADYRIWEGRLWPLVLLFVLVAPRLAFALHSRAMRARSRGPPEDRAARTLDGR